MLNQKTNNLWLRVCLLVMGLLLVCFFRGTMAEASTLAPMPVSVSENEAQVVLTYSEASFLQATEVTVQLGTEVLEKEAYQVDATAKTITLQKYALASEAIQQGIEVFVGANGYERRHFVLKGTPLTLCVSLTYNANTVSGAFKTEVVPINKPFIVKGKLFLWDDDHAFIGWTHSADGTGKLYRAGSVLKCAEDTTLYAKWVKMYDVVFDGNGGTIQGQPRYCVKAAKDQSFVSEPASHPTLWFDGWNTAPDGSGSWASFPFVVSAPTTYYAQWAPKVTVCYEPNGGTGSMGLFRKNEGRKPYQHFVQPCAYKKAEAQFAAWNSKEDGSGDSYQPFQTIEVTEDLHLYAQWLPNTPTLTYDANTGTGTMAPIAVPQGTAVVVADNAFEKSNHRFIGWNTKADGTGSSYAVGASLSLKNHTTLYAQWLPNTATLAYDANTGTGTMAPIAATQGTAVVVAENAFEKSGHRFIGWNTEADGTGISYAAGASISLQSNMTLYAQWKRVSHASTEVSMHRVTVEVLAGDGQVECAAKALVAGAVGNIKLIPAKEYMIDTVRILTDDDKTVEHWQETADCYCWKMPNTRVRVQVAFKKRQSLFNWGYHEAYVHGYPDRTIRPLASMNRAEAATMLAAFINPQAVPLAPQPFAFQDVLPADWAYASVLALQQQGVIYGRERTLFARRETITRGEFMTWCVRMTGKSSAATTMLPAFRDMEGHWAAEAIAYAQAQQWVCGDGQGCFYPDKALTRAEAMAILNRLTGRQRVAQPTDTPRFTDNPSGTWYAEVVQLASHTCSV